VINFNDSVLINSWLLPAAVTEKHSKLELQGLINFECCVPMRVVPLSVAFLHYYSSFTPLCLFSKETYKTLRFDFIWELGCS
jgi:hypothetical protein